MVVARYYTHPCALLYRLGGYLISKEIIQAGEVLTVSSVAYGKLVTNEQFVVPR